MQKDSTRHKTQFQRSHSKINLNIVLSSAPSSFQSWPVRTPMTIGILHLTKNSETWKERQMVRKHRKIWILPNFQNANHSTKNSGKTFRLQDIFEILGTLREVVGKFKREFSVDWKFPITTTATSRRKFRNPLSFCRVFILTVLLP